MDYLYIIKSMKITYSFRQSVRYLYRHWLTVGFVLGFFTDLMLLNQIDNIIDNMVLLFYAVLATASLLLLYVGITERVSARIARGLVRYSPVVMQYAFGGLLSGMLIFYGRSGDWLASWPFLLVILSVIFGNELVDKRSDRLVYQIALYFIGIFSYVVLVVPVIVGKMGDGIFILSGFIALMVVTFVIRILYRIMPNFMQANTSRMILTVGGIYVGFNALYFANVIPPIPLSLTELSIVQSVSRMDEGGYRVSYEEQSWYRLLPLMTPVLHPTGKTISCFARVFAPTKLSTQIFQRWEYKDVEGDWQEHFRLGYDISGASIGGYGGYTSIKSFSDGVWRCSVETERGQVLGRETVKIDTVGEVNKIVTRIE